MKTIKRIVLFQIGLTLVMSLAVAMLLLGVYLDVKFKLEGLHEIPDYIPTTAYNLMDRLAIGFSIYLVCSLLVSVYLLRRANRFLKQGHSESFK